MRRVLSVIRTRDFIIASGLVVLIAIAYWPVAGNGFVELDDRAFLVENPAVRAGLDAGGVAWAFSTTADSNWIPLSWLTLLADQEIHGLSPKGTHITSAILHGLACVLIFLALARMTGARGPSAFTAAVFAVHPLHVESVAWAMQRKDVLSAVFFGGTLLAYAAYARRPSRWRFLVVLLLFALGLMSKPMLVTLPCVLLLLDYWPLHRLVSPEQVRRALLEKVPLLVLSFLASVGVIRAQEATGALRNLEGLSFGWRLANASVSYATYLVKAVWPFDLAILYPHPRDGLAMGTVVASTAFLLAVTAAAAHLRNSRPWFAVGWLWYLGMLVPVIGLVQVGQQAMADRYTYLPLVGATIPLAWTGLELASRRSAMRAVVVSVAAVAVLGCVLQTRRQLAYWRDAFASFERALAVTRDNAVAHGGMGTLLLRAGRIEEARHQLERAVAIRPGLAELHGNLGISLVGLGEPAAAIPHLEKGLALPNPAMRARIHAQLAAAHLALEQPEEALEQARLGLEIDADDPRLHLVAGAAHISLGRFDRGESELLRAEALGADSPQLHALLGYAFHEGGREAEAAERYRRALAKQPDSPELASDLAWILATARDPMLRDPKEAIRLAELARRGTGEPDAGVLATLSVAYHAAGRSQEALVVASQAADAARAADDEAFALEIEHRAEDWRRQARTPTPP